ncbi:asparagine synthase-related protein [Mucilaginibacter ginsenosidivorans]|uniref:Asparagine synthetase B family protein n=1 Tax=Mucilaginibacter ginsenosidivorans TaxID=398053 RepID=A0A5B8UXS4_9SPHI|nr:asparagine synthase-related protein [Mucilaginibacter ginsenosidivorans]QEC63762.1 asparagine synthetase B family protein [Mucilaginibacter ginsenosidivorans]
MNDLNTAAPTDFISLLDDSNNVIFNMTMEDAAEAVISGDAARVRQIEGQFAIVKKVGQQVFLARSIGRPMRYFLAKQVSGPLLIVAERIDEIYEYLKTKGLHTQFHPSYTRMVPAHYVVRLEVIGCPDPNPVYTRYFEPKRNSLTNDLDKIGKTYIEALANECQKWLMSIPEKEPIGVLFSGGIDSGSVFLVLYHLMLKLGLSPQRLKAFTLSVNNGPDAAQAHEFLDKLGLSIFLEVIDVPQSAVDYKEAIKVIEDYKPRDLESATMALALCKQIRKLYPEWKYLADGDGGDENLKDYPIEENTELTIRSVLNNMMLYQEGWGVDKIKHSLTYSGGQSRGHVRSYAPCRLFGFKGLSPYALPNVIEVAEGIPFIQLTNWSEETLYALKGEIVQRGVKAVTGLEMPVFEKRRFQLGAASESTFKQLFPQDEMEYRTYFNSLYA